MDPATKRILIGDENQRLHKMHTRRLVPIHQELTDTDIKVFNARLALKKLLHAKHNSFDKRDASIQLRGAMIKLQEEEQSRFERDFLDSVGGEQKPVVHGWKEQYHPEVNDVYLENLGIVVFTEEWLTFTHAVLTRIDIEYRINAQSYAIPDEMFQVISKGLYLIGVTKHLLYTQAHNNELVDGTLHTDMNSALLHLISCWQHEITKSEHINIGGNNILDPVLHQLISETRMNLVEQLNSCRFVAEYVQDERTNP